MLVITRTLNMLALTCLGPGGRFKVLRLNPKSELTCVSSVSSRLCSTPLQSPPGQLLKHLVLSHTSSSHDGGLLTLSLATGLIHRALKQKIPFTLQAEAHLGAMNLCLDVIGLHSIPCSWSDMHIIVGLMRSVIGPKKICALTDEELNSISLLIVETFVSAIDDSLPNIQLFCRIGSPFESQSFPGQLLPKTAAVHIPHTNLSDIRSILFNVSLFVTEQDGIECSVRAGQFWTADVLQRSKMNSFVLRCKNLSVGLVASQKLIHPYLKHLLVKEHIAFIERISILHIHTFHQVAGGSILGSPILSDVLPHHLGHLDIIQEIVIHNTSYINIQGECESVYTIFLHFWSEEACQEGEVCVLSCLGLLKNCFRSLQVLPGAGSIEIIMANRLRQAAESQSHMTKTVYLNFASCLESYAAALSRSLPQCESISLLKSYNGDGKQIQKNYYGWTDKNDYIPMCVFATDKDDTADLVVDCGNTKSAALRKAVEITNTLIRIDGCVINSHPG